VADHETAAEALARLYDGDLEVDDPGDLELYLALATRSGGPVLELAAGSGRIAVPLAAAGHRVTAVDIDPAMLARARSRAAAAGVDERVRLVEADLLDLRLDDAGSYRLAILALNSLFLLAARRAQASALRVMAEHLAPGGLAVVDVWLPTAADLARYDGRLLLDGLRTDPATGRQVAKLWAATHDSATQTVVLTTLYDEGLPGTPPIRWARRDAMRLVTADELRTFAGSAGLEIEVLAGDHDLEPLAAGSERAVLVARRP
jgi:SAM-dependent methyltransferase